MIWRIILKMMMVKLPYTEFGKAWKKRCALYLMKWKNTCLTWPPEPQTLFTCFSMVFKKNHQTYRQQPAIQDAAPWPKHLSEPPQGSPQNRNPDESDSSWIWDWCCAAGRSMWMHGYEGNWREPIASHNCCTLSAWRWTTIETQQIKTERIHCPTKNNDSSTHLCFCAYVRVRLLCSLAPERHRNGQSLTQSPKGNTKEVIACQIHGKSILLQNAICPAWYGKASDLWIT